MDRTAKERKQRNRDKWRDLAITALGSRCQRCGIKDKRILEIDHVFGNGRNELKSLFKNDYVQFRRDVVERSDSGHYQLLCCNCHRLKTLGL